MIDKNFINTLHAALISQDPDICAVTLGIIAEACRHSPCREVVAQNRFVELMLERTRSACHSHRDDNTYSQFLTDQSNMTLVDLAFTRPSSILLVTQMRVASTL